MSHEVVLPARCPSCGKPTDDYRYRMLARQAICNHCGREIPPVSDTEHPKYQTCDQCQGRGYVPVVDLSAAMHQALDEALKKM